MPGPRVRGPGPIFDLSFFIRVSLAMDALHGAYVGVRAKADTFLAKNGKYLALYLNLHSQTN